MDFSHGVSECNIHATLLFYATSISRQLGTHELLLTLINSDTCLTGIKGWYPINLPGDSDVHDATPPGNAKKVIGGLELNLHFSEVEDRNHVIHISRGAGWSPLAGVECDDNDSFGEEEIPKAINWEMSLKISKAWIPVSDLHSFYSGATKVGRGVKAYARYKLFNKG